MIRLNVFIQVEEAKKAELEKVVKELVAASVKDAGCVAYDVFQSATRNEVLMICETWTDEASLKAHEESTHFTSLVPRMQALAAMKIEKFNF